jgi:hypothetical protein
MKDNPKPMTLFDKHPALTIGAVLLVSIIIMDLSAGLIFIPSPAQDFRVPHPYYHHGLRPDAVAQTTWDSRNYYPFITNSLGFRDDSTRQVGLQTARLRLLFIGDSHAEGVGLPFEQTFTGRLIRKTDPSAVEILNASSVSYSPKLYYLKVKYLIEQTRLRFDHLVVFIDISDIQNELVYENFQPREYSRTGQIVRAVMKFCRSRSMVVHGISAISEKHRQNRFYRATQRSAKNPKTDLYATFFSDFYNTEFLRDKAFHNIGLWYLDKGLFEKWGRKGLNLESDYMMKLEDLCRRHNIRLTISIHPWPVQLAANDRNSIQVQFWKKFAENQGVDFINFFDVFFDLSANLDVARELYFKGDVHWNEKGHAVVSEVLYGYFNSLYPQAFPANPNPR